MVAARYLLIVHGGAALAFVLPWQWRWLPGAVALYVVLGIGTTVGLHRLICHRAFRCPRSVEWALVTAAMLTGQGSPLLWAATHRIHHAFSDVPQDVHSPRRGFWYGHVGWILDRSSVGDDEWRVWCKDLRHDPYYLWLLRFRLVPQFAAIGFVAALEGWAAVPACFLLPMVLWMHATYLVNSASHWSWGSAAWRTGEGSRNVWWVALLALGEGWHNHHHAFPRSARHGLLPGQFDFAWWFICALERLGLAWDVQVPSAATQARRAAAGCQAQPVPLALGSRVN
ncbi:MAG: acyl-CoA desaturase [Myxococcales bacterium]|nr:acyl-CoA desaturase [Myxococcales bacterium]